MVMFVDELNEIVGVNSTQRPDSMVALDLAWHEENLAADLIVVLTNTYSG